jgi:ribosomal protein S18 acetylase RimI-like enzyme
VGYVVTLDVEASQRRRGLARRLMDAVERQAMDAGCGAMALHVSVENDAAMRLYERLGYGRAHHVAGFYGLGLDAWVYRKALEGSVATGGEQEPFTR